METESLVASDVNFCANSVNLLEVEFDLTSIVAFARPHTQRLVTQSLLLLLHSDEALLISVHVEFPRVVYLFETTLLQAVLAPSCIL